MDDGVVLVLDVRATTDLGALGYLYNMTPDVDAVDADEALTGLKHAADKQRPTSLHYCQPPTGLEGAERLAALEQLPPFDDPKEQQVHEVRIFHASQSLNKTITKAIGKQFADDQQVQEWRSQISAYAEARFASAVAGEHNRIHTDYFGHAMPQLPAESAQTDNLLQLVHQPGSTTGTLTWTLIPQTVNIAGWEWQGWSHQFTYEGLPDSPEFRVLRTQGTWELGGEAVGSTIVAMRYRGLGSIEETFGDDGSGGVDRCFTTTKHSQVPPVAIPLFHQQYPTL